MTEFLFQFQVQGYALAMILWNIFLAILPCIIVYRLSLGIRNKKWRKLKGHRIAIVIMFFLWLFLFPNTAYLFTTIRHLVDYCGDYNWYRVCGRGSWQVLFFFGYSFIGVPTFYYALNGMSRIFKKLFGKLPATVFPVVMIPLTSIGLMLGLFERFNSWDVLTRPHEIVLAALSYFTEINRLADFIGFTIVLYFVYYLIRIFLRKYE